MKIKIQRVLNYLDLETAMNNVPTGYILKQLCPYGDSMFVIVWELLPVEAVKPAKGVKNA